MKNRSPLVLAAFCLATLCAVAQSPSQAPTIADIARQKRAEKAKKVYTSEDMKAAEEPPPAATEATEASAAKPTAPKSTEAVAAAEAKVADLRDREILLNKNIARFETSLSAAQQENDENRARIFSESLESARTSLATTTQQRMAAEKELGEMKIAAATAAGAAAASKKKPAPKAPAPKS